MSELRTLVTTVNEIKPHPNADRLEVAEILGWQVIVGKGTFQEGQAVLYVQPDATVPDALAEQFGVTPYLGKGGRVRAIKLRGEPSFGFAVPVESIDWGQVFGIGKYEPVIRTSVSNAAADHALFPRFTDIENLRNYPDALEQGEPIFITEKIHGTNSRVGLIEGEWMAGSHRLRRKPPEGISADDLVALGDQSPRSEDLYWWPLTLPSVKALLECLGKDHKQVVLFGEIYGSVQPQMPYGHSRDLAYAAFDLYVDGRYLNPDECFPIFGTFEVPRVPMLACAGYDFEKVKAIASGPSMVEGAKHIREGVVVRPLTERSEKRIGRIVLKMINPDYLVGNYDSPGEH